MSVEVVEAPRNGVWRVGRSPDPLALSDPRPRDELSDPHTGNRFDSPLGEYRVLYFATKLDGCYGETLARFRPDTSLLALVADEWEGRGWMNVGDVPAAWRQRRIAVKASFGNDGTFAGGLRFLDVEAPETRERLKKELAELLTYFGYSDLDVATVRGGDRRVSRWIAQWAWDQVDDDGHPLYAGIRYLSRLNTDWECWAVFEDVVMSEVERRPVLASDNALRRVAKLYGLRVY